MTTLTLPPRETMLRAFEASDGTFDGVFLTAVRTTGIFCRPACPARKPKPENIEFYPSVQSALQAGYRPCLRCRPMEQEGGAPAWLRPLLDLVEQDPTARITDQAIRDLDLEPVRVRRWFRATYGMTFHAWQRARRLGLALGRIREGEDLTRAAYGHGYESPSAFRDAFSRLFGDTPGQSRDLRPVHLSRIATPLGPMVAGASDAGISLLEFADRPMLETQCRRLRQRLPVALVPGRHPLIEQLEEELAGYFEGVVREFSVPLEISGTPFQERAWAYLRSIPHGETRSYDQEARAIGRPGAHRAVGRANGDNRLAILIPCHRVVRSDGSLSGYGGGLWRKRWLLERERGG
jgi:AraC family transcriptional regulator of adaptative response/methylated-DNA-[protein]-cysteine methyltransferase